ncbi:hypothetical protein [Streptomyces roseolilacinus]|uniref:Uncharacterized protein n=1 Tax=Streptomyces roseolilacinus TaxID=66904 RepID=A0A918B346_9ACTN|nr:hypothetical protein [Streptomyces roseolilacinus]GGQ21314.1 hypothetical protein GCM10010249_45020 [Streptomyces roseolilacinus]
MRPFPSSGRRLAGALTALALSVPLTTGLAAAPAAAATVWTPYDPPLSGSTLQRAVGDVLPFGPSDAFAAGAEYSPWGDAPGGPRLWRWNGTAWSGLALPSGAETGGEVALAGTAPDDVWAFSRHVTGRHPGHHWDGRTWTTGGPGLEDFQPVDAHALTRTDVWAVGDDRTDGGFHAAVAHYDGSAWSVVRVPGADTLGVTLHAVRAVAAGDVWVAGTAGGQPYAAHWDGRAWTRIATPAVPGGASLTAVAAGNGAVSLGGTSATPSNRAFVLHRTATGWTTTHPLASAGRLRSLTYSGDRLVAGLARPAGAGDCGTACVAEWTGTAWTGRAAPLVRSEAVELTGIPGGGLWAATTSSLDRSEHLARSTP